MDQIKQSQLLTDLRELAKRSGEMIKAAARSNRFGFSIKANNTSDIVTQTDKAVEQMIFDTLRSKYSDFQFYGEETYTPGQRLGDEPTFVVDPLDGTTNFVHRFGFTAVSLGVTVGRQPVVGVVLSVFEEVLYCGARGQGSWIEDLRAAGGEECRIPLPLYAGPPLRGLQSCLVALEWGSERKGVNWDVTTKTWLNLGRAREEGGGMIRSSRCIGSAALTMCKVAEGSLDVYWEGGIWAWDICAGWIILIEAGGIIVDGNPGRWETSVDSRKCLAVRRAEGGQKEVVTEFWSHVAGNMEYDS
jgi:myo-inositol-1(or 4)-monophosphatase